MTTAATPVDVYYKKRISYTCCGRTFAFDVAHTLFSSYQIDEGTDLLLRTIKPQSPQTILDLGCGCGVIGIVLASWFPQARVVLVDRDLLAVRYARHNAALNQTPNVEVIGSVGFEHVPAIPFDLIVSNIPAKIGDEAIEREFILDPLDHLRPGGEYWFVVVSGLNRLIPVLGRRHQLRMKEVKKRAGHTVYYIHRTPA
ncbi:MAG: class I SAM-dependent methyltransferase [Roseiflexus sp.]|nr:class I SAM-dependent methyltransferase [Roseiflexus sp.]MCS7289426.1 class I SAM-dependent methyltransferase [Roseiflexus sp.]MDW8144892.1 methyltransferase [Roseiflexaceae bacterium]MDW8233913.1 methyltransferase [Roseiflexaceae bacterium]